MPLTDTALPDGSLLAAIDIGSNSFHMVVARTVLGHLRVVDRLRETVRMAWGLRPDGSLDPAAVSRALECLSRFGERIGDLPAQNVRAIATNTVRQLRDPQTFLVPAETALGHPIEIVSGREEARLIYLGVAHGLPPKNTRRLVIDIGGGSTEFIIGQGFTPLERESLQMGCVASTRRFFPDERITEKRWNEARTELAQQFQQFSAAYRELGWKEAIGSSGTAKAIAEMLAGTEAGAGTITRKGVDKLAQRMIDFKSISNIDLPGVSADRRPVIAGGLLVMQTSLHELGIEKMQACDTAMREGVLHDLLGRASQRDPRETTIAAYAVRYGVDTAHAARVEATALALFDQVAQAWELDADDRHMLAWAARIHELGLAISHSQHQKHAAYIIANSDMDGFSRQEQHLLATLVRCQRRGISRSMLGQLPARQAQSLLRLIVLLRLSILLHRSHTRETLPPLALSVSGNDIRLSLPKIWLDAHALTRADLATERKELDEMGLRLGVETVA
ncbi:MAG: exopolyphosphatase [Lysobacteraceae bacterium]